MTSPLPHQIKIFNNEPDKTDIVLIFVVETVLNFSKNNISIGFSSQAEPVLLERKWKENRVEVDRDCHSSTRPAEKRVGSE